MCGHADDTPSFRLGKEFNEIEAPNGRGRFGTVNLALTNEPFEGIILVGIEQAQKMDAVLGNGLKAAKGEQAGGAGSLY